MTELAELRLKSAIKAARSAGALIKNRFGTNFKVAYKSGWDPVTEVDEACEKQIKDILTSEHPSIAFCGEESGSTDANARLTWIVDPLDGTKNYVHGYPFVAVSIALVEDGEPTLGVIYDPIRDELFSAVKGEGAFLDGEPITVSECEEISDALVVTTLGVWPEVQGNLLLKACQYCQGVRRGGAAALDLAQLAAGRVDAIWEWNLKPWDVAAAIVLIREAQGTVTDHDGSSFDFDNCRILATNTNLHKAFRDFIQQG